MQARQAAVLTIFRLGAAGASPAKAPAQSQVAAAAEAAAADARRWRAVAAAAAVMALLLVALQSREMRLPLGLLERSSTVSGQWAPACSRLLRPCCDPTAALLPCLSLCSVPAGQLEVAWNRRRRLLRPHLERRHKRQQYPWRQEQ